MGSLFLIIHALVISCSICQKTGEYNQPYSVSFVEITCSVITGISRAVVVNPPSCSINISSYGTDCRFSCNSGYQLLGPGVKTCTHTSKWSPDNKNPSCKGRQANVVKHKINLVLLSLKILIKNEEEHRIIP